MALLTPQWQKEQQDARQEAEDREKQTGIALEQDSRRALEFQRQRLILQKQADSGAIDPVSYAQQDRAAVTGITDLRKKYETAGALGGGCRRGSAVDHVAVVRGKWRCVQLRCCDSRVVRTARK